MNMLHSIIVNQIKRFGPINLAEYMTLCLLHPEHGYYIKGTPIGRHGDFITAPEISQMFGEMLGLCLVQTWFNQGHPDPFILVELGPGRGTLMADILRAAKAVPGFLQAAQIWLVEVSDDLKGQQSKTLKDYNPHWVDKIEDLPDRPIFLVANEFFDALPMRQFHRTKDGWQERMLGLSAGELSFGLASPLPVDAMDQWPDATIGDIVETSAPAQAIAAEISGRIKDHGGVALIVDYGHFDGKGDTFQALRQHQKTDPLMFPGESDLTAHVNFASLVQSTAGIDHSAMTAQGVLLERLGITERAQTLADNLTGDPLQTHIAAHRRLTHPAEMGALFQAIALYPRGATLPPGFDLHVT